MPDSRIVLGDLPSVARGTDRYIHLGIGYIDACEDRFLFHERPFLNYWPFLAKCGLDWPMQLLGLYFGTGAATLAIERSSMTKQHSVCRTPIHVSEVIISRQNQDTRSIILHHSVASGLFHGIPQERHQPLGFVMTPTSSMRVSGS